MFDGYSLSLAQVKAGVLPMRVDLQNRVRADEEYKKIRDVYQSYTSRKTGYAGYKSFKYAWELTFPDDVDLSIDTNLIKGIL